jgi:hypothetical protein
MTYSGFKPQSISMKPKVSSRLAPVFPDLEPLNDLLRSPPRTTEDRLLHIAALGRRIERYIRFMESVANMVGSSAEAKEIAVAFFHQRLAALEPALGRIPKKLQDRSTKESHA